MKNNLRAATLIIASLSLLLGLSIGQIHRQYLEIKDLQSQIEPGFEDEDFNFDFDYDFEFDVEPAEEYWYRSSEDGIYRFEIKNKCDEWRTKRDELHALQEHWQAEQLRMMRELRRQEEENARLHLQEMKRHEQQEREASSRVIIIR